MAIPDVYVVPYLLQSTQELPSNLRWSDGESGTYVTNIRGVQVELGQLLSTTGSRYHVALSFNLEKVFIEEPRSVAFFRKRYESEDQQRLPELTMQLASAVSRQCAADRRGEDQIERSRDSI